MSLITVCMIVKNEEKNLARALESARKLTDDIVIVDTGSTDRSVEIAESFGAKIYHHEWQNDFSLHRNQSLEYAEGRWCFILDADEEIIFEMPVEQFLNDLMKVQIYINGIFLELVDIQGGREMLHLSQLRIFRKGCVHYEGPIHNEPKVTDPKLGMVGLKIYHYGYDLSHEKMEAKYNRTYNMLIQRTKDDPEWKQAYFYLAEVCGQHGRIDEAERWSYLYITHREKLGSKFAYTIYWSYSRLLWMKGQHEQAIKWIKEGLEHRPEDLDLNFTMAEYSKATGDNATMWLAARAYLNTYFTLKKTKALSPRFTYTYTDECFCIVLFWIATLSSSEAITAFDLLRSGDYRLPEGMSEEIDQFIKDYGLSDMRIPCPTQ